MVDNVAAGLRKVGATFDRRMQARMRTKLKRRSGMLARSIRYRVKKRGKSPNLRIFSLSPYAPTHEYGATIRPDKAAALTIPIEDNLTKSGLPRNISARALMDDETRKTFIWRSRISGNAYIVERKDSGELLILFLLRSSVKIPARLGWYSTWDQLGSYRRRVLTSAVARTLRGQRLS